MCIRDSADTDPLLHFDIDTVTHEIMLSFLGNVQMEVICAIPVSYTHLDVYKRQDKIKADYPEIPAYEEYDELLAAIRNAMK